MMPDGEDSIEAMLRNGIMESGKMFRFYVMGSHVSLWLGAIASFVATVLAASTEQGGIALAVPTALGPTLVGARMYFVRGANWHRARLLTLRGFDLQLQEEGVGRAAVSRMYRKFERAHEAVWQQGLLPTVEEAPIEGQN